MVDGVTAVDPSCRQSVMVARSVPTAYMASPPCHLLLVIRSLRSSSHLVRFRQVLQLNVSDGFVGGPVTIRCEVKGMQVAVT